MSIFDTKSTDTKTVSVPDRGQGEQDFLSQLVSLFGGAQGQMGDLSGLASGNLPQLSPEMLAWIEQIGQGASQTKLDAIQEQGNDAMRGSTEALAGRGIDRSSIDAVNEGLIRRDMGRASNQVVGEQADFAANMKTQMPFQLADTQMSANQLLMQLLTGSGGMLNQNYLSDRLAQTTTTNTSETSGNPFSALMGLGSQLAGAGGFNPLLSGLGGGANKDNGQDITNDVNYG